MGEPQIGIREDITKRKLVQDDVETEMWESNRKKREVIHFIEMEKQKVQFLRIQMDELIVLK